MALTPYQQMISNGMGNRGYTQAQIAQMLMSEALQKRDQDPRMYEALMGAGGSGGAAGGNAAAGYMDQMNQFANGINPTMGVNRFEAGLSSMENRLTGLLDDPTKIKQTAAYKFRTGQGEEALNRQMAAKGMLGSGNRLQELMKYGQDMASQEYDTQLGRLQGLVGTYGGNWNQAQGTNVNQYLGEMGQKRNALSDMISGANTAQGQANQYDLGIRKLDQDTPQVTSGMRVITKGWG